MCALSLLASCALRHTQLSVAGCLAGMSPDGPSGWTLYAREQQQRTEQMAAKRAFIRRAQEAEAAATSLPKTMPTPKLPPPSEPAADGSPATSGAAAASKAPTASTSSGGSAATGALGSPPLPPAEAPCARAMLRTRSGRSVLVQSGAAVLLGARGAAVLKAQRLRAAPLAAPHGGGDGGQSGADSQRP